MSADLISVPGIKIDNSQVMNRLTVLRESSIWQSEHGRILFWKDCDVIFTKYRLPPEIAAKFYQEHTFYAGSAEKVYLCKSACRWLALTDQTSARHQARTALWRAQIELEIKMEEGEKLDVLDSDLLQSSMSSDENGGYSKQDLMVYGQVPRESLHANLSQQETVGVRSLLGKLLSRGHVMEACSLAAEFGHHSSELAIIMTCIGLALGEIDVSSMDPELRTLVQNHVTIPRRRSRGSSFTIPGSPGSQSLTLSGSSFGSESGLESHFPRHVQTTLLSMTSLLEQCHDGYQCCARVITTYAIAQVLERSYSSVLMKEECEVLEALLATSHWNMFDLARDFITTSSMSDSEVSGFLAGYVIKLLSERRQDSPDVADILDDQTWQSLMRLCTDPALLGQQLLDATTTRIDNEDNKTGVVLEVDLLIRSHDCFTVSCHMEGINSVLRTARKLTARIVTVHEFPLIIRLLVGIARYSEMTYIFDLLKHHQEFLLLFKKGVEKDSRLKMAVLDYLKRFHPSDVETYNMVALHYSMYREIAQLLETEAVKMLRDISSKTLEDCTETLQRLSTIEQYLCDAAESYMKDDCYRHANNVMKRARLVALQQQLLSSNVHVLNLTTEALNKFIVNHRKFSEAYIVAEAYNRRSEWPNALCERVLVDSDWKYLADFQSLIPVTETMVEEVVQRYRLQRTVTNTTIVNMKRFLRCCDNVEKRYQLASSLGFTDVTQELLRGEAASFLKDVLNISS